MIVVIHQAIGVTELAVSIDNVGEQREKLRAIAIIDHEILPGIATTGDRVDGAGKFKAKWPGHAEGVHS
jgi:hypothetical protein